jgi:hypothetical protein
MPIVLSRLIAYGLTAVTFAAGFSAGYQYGHTRRPPVAPLAYPWSAERANLESRIDVLEAELVIARQPVGAHTSP